MLLTPANLKNICPTLSTDSAVKLCNLFETILPEFKMYQVDIMQEFIAQVAHESGEFTIKRESLNYSAERLMAVWPSRFPTLAAARHYAHRPQDLANYVYGKRMGNLQPNDGWNFIGGGFMQLTGRDSYTKYAKYCGFTLPGCGEDPAVYAGRVIRTDDYWALHSACWEFAIDKKLLPLTLVNDWKTDAKAYKQITLTINGGLIGYDSRLKYLERSVKYITG